MVLVGDLPDGFCGGQFGRDSYGPKRVEAVGAEWVLVREEDGQVQLATGPDVHARLWPCCRRHPQREA